MCHRNVEIMERKVAKFRFEVLMLPVISDEENCYVYHDKIGAMLIDYWAIYNIETQNLGLS